LNNSGSVDNVLPLRIRRPTYNPEFRAAAIAMVRSGQMEKDVARTLGCSDRQIRRWLVQTDIDAGERAGLTTIQQRELTLLRRANARLQEQIDLMRDAQSFFSPETRRNAARSSSQSRKATTR
jgi:transposase-like protein